MLRSLHSSALLSSAVLPRSHCLQDAVSYTVSKSFPGAAILALVVKVQCYSTVSAGQNIKDNNRGRLVLGVLLTENKPIEIRNCITSSLAAVHDSHFKCSACMLELWVGMLNTGNISVDYSSDLMLHVK